MAGAPVSRVWVFTFFVMGVIIGLLLLVLGRGLHLPGPAKRAALSPPARVQETPPRPLPTAPEGPVKAPSPPEASPTTADGVFLPLQCDRAAAQAVVERARRLAAIAVRGAGLELQLSAEWEYYSPGHRRSFVEAFSEADRCLQGRYRELHLLYRGEEVATVDTAGAVQLQ